MRTRRLSIWCLLATVLWWLLLPAYAQPAASGGGERLSANVPMLSLDGRLAHYADASGKTTFAQASAPMFVEQHFQHLPDGRSLGYNTDTHWFQVALHPTPDAPSRWVLVIGTPELETVDVWVQQRNGTFRPYPMGYHQPYQNRPLRTRMFALPMDVFDGMQLFLRVRTTNAINVHASLWQVDAYTAHETRSNFYRGGYFGILLIAFALYVLLGVRLRDMVMGAYAGYVAAQLLFHLGTNGYLPVLLGNNAQWYTDALPRIGWLGGAIAIVVMWDTLLDLKNKHPNLHRLFLITIFLNLFLLPFALMPSLVREWLLHVVAVANALNSLNFFLSMVVVWRLWRSEKQAAMLVYFVAFIIPAIGAAVNSAVNQALLPWNVVTENFYQAAALVHVLVMSYGLTLRLQLLQHDKTEAKQEAEIATRRAQEQRRFVAMLSHEFGNPLAAINRSAEMLQLKLPHLPASETKRLEQIRSNASTLAGFVDHFLMTEGLEHGALTLHPIPCNIHELLCSVVEAQNEVAQARLHIVQCSADTFPLDPTLIRTALGNLVANALRYSPANMAVDLRAYRDAHGLHLHVTDHGVGLVAEELEKLGTPYFRASTSLGKKGSGLGYHFTRRIVEAHGGTLVAHSPEDAGLDVEIVLPDSP